MLATALVVGFLSQVVQSSGPDERQLSFYHTHTQESLTITYSRNEEYVDSALTDINEFLSDFRTGDQIKIEPTLLDLIWDVRSSLDSDGTFEVISAYRSPATNEMLRSNSSGVAKNSQHVLGNAIDVRLRNVDTKNLRDAAISQKRGGVGYYKDSNFVHIDVGRVRQW